MSSPREVKRILENYLKEYDWPNQENMQDYVDEYDIPQTSRRTALAGIVLAYEEMVHDESEQMRLFYAILELKDYWPITMDQVQAALYREGREWGIFKRVARNFRGFNENW